MLENLSQTEEPSPEPGPHIIARLWKDSSPQGGKGTKDGEKILQMDLVLNLDLDSKWEEVVFFFGMKLFFFGNDVLEKEEKAYFTEV